MFQRTQTLYSIYCICYEIHGINKNDIEKAHESIERAAKRWWCYRRNGEQQKTKNTELQSTAIDYENQICFICWIESDFSGNNVPTELNSGKSGMMKTHGIWNWYRFFWILPPETMNIEYRKMRFECRESLSSRCRRVSKSCGLWKKYIYRNCRVNKTFGGSE